MKNEVSIVGKVMFSGRQHTGPQVRLLCETDVRRWWQYEGFRETLPFLPAVRIYPQDEACISMAAGDKEGSTSSPCPAK